jgi:gliding motility-associated-like protein
MKKINILNYFINFIKFGLQNSKNFYPTTQNFHFMKKITLLLLFLLISVCGYAQTEGFEGTPSPAGPLPQFWTLNSGTWAIFENNTPVTVGSGQSWEDNVGTVADGLQHSGAACAFVSREQIGIGGRSEDYLASPVISIPATGTPELHFWTRLFTSGNQGTEFRVMIAPANDPSNQINPFAYNNLRVFSELDLIIPASNYDTWTEITVPLTDYAGLDVYIAFVRIYDQPTATQDGDRWLVDDFGVALRCDPPVTGTTGSITSNSATLTWTPPTGAPSWEIELIPAANSFTGAVTNTHTGPPPFTIPPTPGLTPNTAYKYRVRGICANGFTSDWSSASAIFTTLVAPPVCGGNLVDSGGIAGNYTNNANSSITVCPVNPGDLVTVAFTAFNTEAGADFLKIYDGNDASATLLANLSGTTIPGSYTSTAVTGCLTFVFTSNATNVAAGYAGNITCNPPPACRVPTALTNNTVTTTSIVLNWVQPVNPDLSTATQWQVLAVPCGSPVPGATPPVNGILATANTNTNFLLGGLTPATCYDIYVRANCATNSGWSPVPSSIVTLVAPPVCGGNFVDTGGLAGNYGNNENLTSVICPGTAGDAVTVTFTSFNTQAANDFLNVYDGDTVSATLIATLSGTTLPPAFTSTAPSGCLTFQFTSNGATAAAGWVANVTCGPPPACAVPTALHTVAVTNHNSATLSWTQPANPDASTASSWQVIALPCGSPVPGATPPVNAIVTTANTNSNFVFTGLTPNTCFDIYVRSICGATNSGWITLPISITTLIAPPECGGNYADAGGTTGTYAPNSNITTIICPTTPGDVVTVTFTSFNTETNFDALYVYDGNTVTAGAQIASANPAANVPGGVAGGFWGTTIPGPFTSSAANGCLTFVFRSDGSVQNPGWLANVTCGPPPTCRRPTAITITAPTSTSVVLTWTQPTNPDNSVATAWEVLAVPCGSPVPGAVPPANGILAPANTNTNFLFSPLIPATCYDIYIRAICSPTDSSGWGGPVSVTTQVAPPVCGGNFVDAAGPTTNYAPNSNVTTTICPTTPGDVVTVTFTSFNTEPNFDALYVYDGNAVVPGNIIASTNPAANVPGGVAGGYWGTTIPGPFTSSAADGCLTFVFRSDGSVQNPGFISTITCGPPPTCRRPTAILATLVTHNTVTLNWTQPTNPDNTVASQWQVLALPCGSPLPGAIPPANGILATANTRVNFLMTNLLPNTCYDIYIRAVCSPTDSSGWGGPTTITTLVAPPICGGTFVDAGGAAGAYPANSNVTTIICPTNPGELVTVTFTSFNTEVNFDALYVYDGNTVNPATQIASANPAANVPGGLAGGYWGNNNPGPFTSTTPDGCLTFVFRSDGSVNNPGWVADVTCSPAPTCIRPALITAFPVTQTSATLNWTQFANPDGSVATSWEVVVLLAGSLPPAGGTLVSVTDIPSRPPYIVNGLSPGTQYVFYVRAICSPTDSSEWSAFNFATQPLNDECINATFAIVNQNLNCVQTTHGTLAGATASSPPTTCGGAGAANDDVWFTFTATAATHVISFNNVFPATALSYAVYQGTCGGLAQVGCNTGANLIGGQTYYIRVFSTGIAPVFTNFDLCIGTLPCTEAPAFCTGQTVTYANATNVPSLGTIGCLGTSPNPAFFFLQVNQAGPLSYLISQVDTGGIGRDVDYVAWGPFTDLSTACSGVPANPLPGATPIPTPATGCPGTLHACSYSTAPQEIMCIPNAQLCEVYVIMITNFSNQVGTVTFTQTNSGGGTTECFPINRFSYNTYYCQNEPNPSPVLAPGATSGTYSSTPGLVIDPVTGVINLAASIPGPYIITATTQTSTSGVCTNIPTITSTWTVIITAPADAAISYTAATYCNSITAPQPVTRTGTLGGTYSASPAGLVINAINGEIIPVASLPGVYTITYTIPASGGCAPFTTTAQVEILAAPVVTQASVAACDTFTLPALTVGDYYTQAGGPTGTGTLLDPNDPIETTQPIYIYAEATNGCVTERQFTVTINTVDVPTYTVTQSSCTLPTGSITVTSPVSAGGALPSNIFISEVTDADTGSLTYVELYNATGAPVNLANYKLKFYTWGSPPTTENLQCDLQLAGTIPNNATNVIKVSNNANITGVVPNQTFASCAGVNNNDNIRLTTASDVLVDQWGTIDGSTYTPAGQAGYTYRRLNTSTIPNTTWIPADWTAIDPEDYTNIGSYTYLASTYQYSIDNGGTYQTNPAFSNVAPGPHILIVRDVTTGCLSEPITVIIDAVNAIPSVTTFTYVTPICQNATTNPLPDTSAAGFTAGGVFTSNPAAGIVIDPATGEINLAGTTSGTYDITYTIAFDPVTCQSFSATTFTVVITNVVTPVVGFNYTTPICQNAQATLAPTLDPGFSTGGTFTSTTGLTINGTTGVIDLANSAAGSYTITYTFAGNSCQVASVGTFNIVINPVITPVTTFTYTTPICLSATVNPMPNTSATGFTTGGTFTSNPSAGIDINPTTGEINLAGSTAGTYVITYATAVNSSTCQVAGSTDFTVVITSVIAPVVGFSYTTPICKNAQATLSPSLNAGFTIGGAFSSTTGLSINASTGVIDLANSTAGTYVVTYTVTANASICQGADSGTFTVVINPVITPVTGFSYDTPFCSSATSSIELPNTVTGFTTGGTFSSTTGLIIDPTTGGIDLSSTPGNYTVTYSVAANAATCQVVSTSTAQIAIVGPILIELNGGCQSVYVLNATPVNGSFDPLTATFSWQNAQGDELGTEQSFNVPVAGSYTVTVTANGCSTESAPFEVTTVACQIQRGISVNNDGFNDTFDLTGFDVKELNIFNRYGMKVYSHANYVNEWGGKSDDGDELPDGTYFYVIDKNSGDSVTGWIYINRAQ